MDENIQMVTIFGWERMKGASANGTLCPPFTIYNKKGYEMHRGDNWGPGIVCFYFGFSLVVRCFS